MNNRKLMWSICPRCEGCGQIDNPAFSNGFTDSERDEWDADFMEAYLQGQYDVSCPDCKGAGKVQIPNMAALSFSEKRELVEQRRTARYSAEIAAEYAAERRAGC